MSIKALTLRQPWAWMVVHGGKHIENRTWSTAFRGEFLIHAAKGMTKAEYEEALDFAYGVFADERSFYLPGSEDPIKRCPTPMPKFEELERGGVIGKATLQKVLDPPTEIMSWSHDWRMVDQYGFVLVDVQPLPFKACKGALGFWNYEEGTGG